MFDWLYWIFGKILFGIDWAIFHVFGIHNIGLCVIFFTIIVYLLMYPLNSKQQKSSRLMSKINPELQEIQKKYKNKRDQASQMKMNEETQALYAKYGISPFGGCLPLLISFPIMICLYRVIYSMGDYFALMVNEKIYEAKTVILATGVEFSKPLKGELEYLGKGVGYCATCDAPLYKGKTVCIISSNLEGEGEANYVSELAEKVYYIPLYKNEYKLNSNIELVKDRPIEVCGDIKVNKLILKTREIETDGVFLLKDAISPSQLVPGLEESEGHIKVDRSMRTNLKGLFACGDCVGKPYQYIKAAGEGNIAALSAVEYLNNY